MRFPLITSIALLVSPLALAAPVGGPFNTLNLEKRNDIPCGAIGFWGPTIPSTFPPSTGTIRDDQTGGPDKPSKQDDDVEVPSSQNDENDDSGEQGDEDDSPGGEDDDPSNQDEVEDDDSSNEDDEDEDVGEPDEEDDGDEDTTEEDNDDEESEVPED